MSRVTGIVLCFSCVEVPTEDDNDHDVIRACNEYLRSNRHGDLCLQAVPRDAMGGRKHPQMIVFVAGINYLLEPDEFARIVTEYEQWECPENVVLIMQPEDGPTVIYRPKTRT